MTGKGTLTPFASSRAKEFRDDINLLDEIDEGDEFVQELAGDLRNVFFCCTQKICARLASA